MICLAVSLQACVAAVLPVLAGGAIARSETQQQPETATDSQSASSAQTGDANAQGEQDAVTEAAALAVEEAAEELSRATPQPAEQVSTPAIGTAAEAPSESALSPTALARLEIGKGLEKQRIAEEERARSELIYRQGFKQVAAYALETLAQKDGRKSLPSALLANPSQLDGKRRPCDFGPPAVLIDLDEKGRVFDPNALAPTYDRDSFGHLSRLRESGIAIGWISALTAENAGDVREALVVSGLDVKGEDALVLFRYPNDRKQTRRMEFGREHCLLAIAGDERADFDELFEHLVQPAAAFGLEPLIGTGWFLLPEGSPQNAGQ